MVNETITQVIGHERAPCNASAVAYDQKSAAPSDQIHRRKKPQPTEKTRKDKDSSLEGEDDDELSFISHFFSCEPAWVRVKNNPGIQVAT